MKQKNGYVILEKGEISKYFGYLEDGVKYPENIEKIILEVILERLGIENDNCGNELRDLYKLIPKNEIEDWVNIINDLYSEEEKVDYKNIKNAYLAYYLPINTFKVHRLLRDLLIRKLIKVEVDILDIACGPGSATIGFIEFYKILALNLKDIEFKMSITLLDSEKEFLLIAETLLEKIICDLPSNLKITLHKSKCCKIDKVFKLEYLYDYIIISNLLNGAELDKEFSKKKFFEETITSTSDSGAVLIIEPGEEKQCERLKKIRNKVLKEFDNVNIYSPCNDIWGEKIEYNCKCFTNGKVKWKKPYIIKKLIDNGLIKKADEVAFNYLILRKDGKQKYKSEEDDTKYTKIKNISSEKGKIVNVKGIVRCIIQQENYLWISICDGSEIMADDKHVYLSIRLNNSEIVKQWRSFFESMNIGEKIVAKNVRCEQMWKYKKSYLLNVNEESKIEGFF